MSVESMIAEARRRGIPLEIIARHLGCSRQAIDQRLRRIERVAGRKITPRKRRDLHKVPAATLVQFLCAECGVPCVATASGHKGSVRNGQKYCSHWCGSVGRRAMPNASIIRMVSMRYSGETWTQIGRTFGHSYQNCQYRIWLLLFERGLLTKDVAARIWRTSHALHTRSYSWEWLIKVTGIEPGDDDVEPRLVIDILNRLERD